MNIDVVTKQDFEALDQKLNKILEVLIQKKDQEQTDWMKSTEVKRILHCSDSSLTHYRNKNLLPFTQVGGTYYYSRKDVNEMLNTSYKNHQL